MWEEHVAPEDIESVLAWFGAPGSRPTRFRCKDPSTQAWALCIWKKQRLREYWLVIGDAIRIPDVLAPRCLMIDFSPPTPTPIRAFCDFNPRQTDRQTPGLMP